MEDENITNNKANKMSEADYIAIFDYANDAIFIHDIETGAILNVNRKACEMFLRTHEEMISSSVADISFAEDGYTNEAALRFMKKSAEGEPQIFPWLAKDKAGRPFWVEVNLKKAIIGNKYRTLAIVRDITERKRTEDRLSKINDTFISFNADTDENIDKLVKLCGELLGADCAIYNKLEGDELVACGTWKIPGDFKTVDKAKGHICNDVIKNNSDEIVAIQDLPETSYAETDPNIAKYNLKTYIGKAVKFGDKSMGSLCVVYQYHFSPSDEDKNILALITAAIGIEEERKSAEDINRLAEFSIQRATDEMFWITPDARILYVNDAVCQMLGYSREELLNMTVHDIDPNFQKDVWASHWHELRERHYFTFETMHKRKDGTTFPVEITVNHFEFEGVEYNFAFGRDITERKKAEERLMQRDYQLEILSRTSQHVNAVLEVPTILRTLIAASMELCDAASGSAGLYANGRMEFNEFSKEGKITKKNYSLGSGEGMAGYVINEKKPYICNDAKHDTRIWREKAEFMQLYNAVCVPVINRKGELVGCFEVYNKRDGLPFDAQDVFMLQGLAASAAVALQNAYAITAIEVTKKRLEESEHFLTDVFSGIQDGISVLDKEMNILRVNPIMEKWYAHAMPLVGKKCYDAYHKRARRCDICPSYKTLKEGKAAYEVVPKIGADGKVAGWLDLYSFPLIDSETGDLKGVVEYVRDITARKKAEDEQVRLNKELSRMNKRLENVSLVDAATGLYNHRYFVEVLEREFHRSERSSQPVSVIAIDVDYFKSINDVYGHEFGDAVLKQLADQIKKMVRRYDIVVRYGGEEFAIICAGTDRAKAIMLAQRMHDALNLYNFGSEEHSIKLKLSMAVTAYPEDRITKPADFMSILDKILEKVKADGGNRVYSLLDISNGKAKVPKIAETTDVALLQKKIDKLTRHEKESLIESIFAFAKAIEIRDHYTGAHVESTVHYATEIAKELKLAPEDMENIKEAAVLHDLGKIGISDKILLKKSKLTNKEFEEIKKHPQIAADIIRPIQFMHDIIPLILYHHERWDGQGYPASLKGDEIPLGARVIAIADVYQALTSNRPYRKSFSKKEALDIISKGAGSQFDPTIVKAFLKVMQSIKRSK